MQALHDVVKAGYVRYIGMSSCWAYQFHAMQSMSPIPDLTWAAFSNCIKLSIKTMPLRTSWRRSYQCKTITIWFTGKRNVRCSLPLRCAHISDEWWALRHSALCPWSSFLASALFHGLPLLVDFLHAPFPIRAPNGARLICTFQCVFISYTGFELNDAL